MAWNFDNNLPVYIQIMKKIEEDILAGKYGKDEQIPSVRQLAMEAAVNPNTMQKALSELEKNGILESRRTSGRFVTSDDKILEGIRENNLSEIIVDFLGKIKAYNLSKEELIKLIEEELEG
ncbi:MAG: GntR family transcriptional regulator [Clostridia bacterium]|nr:GntR family transcriptional regulator [Clostridia bacterium]